MSIVEDEPAPLPIPMTTLRDFKEVKKDGLDFKVSMAQHAYLMADAMIAERER